MTRRRATAFAAIACASFVLTTAGLVRAGNQWSCWHWSKNSIGATTVPGGYWGTVLSSELAQWDAGTCIEFTSGDEITVDAGFYGANGWLGIARILDYGSDCTIQRAEALMNRSYLDGPSYDEVDDRHVTCQEIGHTIGLDHRKGPKNQTCMNDMWLGFPDFDQHDADTVAAITGGCSSGGGGGSDPCLGGNEKGKKKCSDGIDNDGDGCIDEADPDCN